MKLQSVSKSDRPGKKLKAVFLNSETGRTKTVHFGAAGMDDYLHSKNKDQRARYRQRHAKDLKGDPTRAGYLSYYILWGNSTSLSANIAAFKNRFNL